MKRVQHGGHTRHTESATPAMFWWAARCISKVENRRAGRFPKAAVTHRLLACLLLAASGWGHTADIVKGAELYRQHCASCHGNQGRPVMVGATDFSQPTALLKPDMNLLQSIRAGRGAMPAYQGLLRDRDLLDIVAHLRTFR